MTERKPIRSEEELAGAFDKLFDEIPAPQSKEEIDDYICEAGIDPNIFGAQIKEMAANALKESPFNWRNCSQDEIEHSRQKLNRFTQGAGQSREELLSKVDNIIGKILSINPKLAPVHYRNLTELSDEDLASLLGELIFIADESNIDIDMGKMQV